MPDKRLYGRQLADIRNMTGLAETPPTLSLTRGLHPSTQERTCIKHLYSQALNTPWVASKCTELSPSAAECTDLRTAMLGQVGWTRGLVIQVIGDLFMLYAVSEVAGPAGVPLVARGHGTLEPFSEVVESSRHLTARIYHAGSCGGPSDIWRLSPRH